MPHKIKVIIKKVNQEPELTEVEDTLASLQEIVDGYIDIIRHPSIENAIIILNDEGKIHNLEPSMTLPEYSDVIVGNFIISSEKEDGDITGLTDEQVKACMDYLQKYQVNNTDMLGAYVLMKKHRRELHIKDELEVEAQ